MTAEPSWTLFLLGGSAGSGKSTAAASIARRLNCSWLSADTIWATLRAATDRTTHPALHHFPGVETGVGAERMVQLHIESSQAISAALVGFVESQLREQERMVLEGAWLTPQFVSEMLAAHKGAVRSSFIYEADPEALLYEMISRSSEPDRTPRRLALADMSWLYGSWLREECERFRLPVVAARPRETLADRILDAASA
jgi:2-phosphoglycerate kinase